MSDLIQKRLWLPPGKDQIKQCGDNAHKSSVQDKCGLDVAAYPMREDKGHDRRGNQDGNQKSLLAKQ